MADPEELLALAKKIAVKARQLIPRSQNRKISGNAVGGQAIASEWAHENIPQYLNLLLMAQRSRSSQNEHRRLINRMVPDVTMRTSPREDIRDFIFKKRLKDGGIDLSTAFDDQRVAKTHHKDTNAVMPMEVEEQSAKNAVRYRIGNCDENAALAFVMFAEYPGPGNDLSLPALDAMDQRPWVEKVGAKNPGDHAFVVINRPQSDVQDVDQWLGKGNVIICDPWWFHAGDALRTNDRSSNLKDALLKYIRKCKTGLRILSGPVRLGCGHSDRFQNKMKYGGLDYYSNSIDQTAGFLRRAPWQRDSDVTRCPLCNIVFFSGTLGLAPRKHHCRNCGRVVCDDCSTKRRVVDYPSTSDGSTPSVSSGEVRVCDTCA